MHYIFGASINTKTKQMKNAMFNFKPAERVIWLCPNTRSQFAMYISSEYKSDGNEWAKIKLMPSGDDIYVLADELVPAF